MAGRQIEITGSISNAEKGKSLAFSVRVPDTFALYDMLRHEINTGWVVTIVAIRYV